MAGILRECITELYKKHTGEEVAKALSEYFHTVEDVAKSYTDNVTAPILRNFRPRLDFMDDDVLEEVLKQARFLRRMKGSQEPERTESAPTETDGRLRKMEELHRKRMEESQRREEAMLAYMRMVAENRHDEAAALLSALDDKALEAKYKDYWDSWGDEQSKIQKRGID